MTICDRICFASRAAALALLVFAVGCDSEEKPAAVETRRPPGRMEDPAYKEQLKSMTSAQKKVAAELNDIERRMDLERRRARAALGAGATEAQVLAELETNSVKYAQWHYLKGRRNAAEKSMKDRKAETVAAVRARILQETREQGSAASPAAQEK